MAQKRIDLHCNINNVKIRSKCSHDKGLSPYTRTTDGSFGSFSLLFSQITRHKTGQEKRRSKHKHNCQTMQSLLNVSSHVEAFALYPHTHSQIEPKLKILKWALTSSAINFERLGWLVAANLGYLASLGSIQSSSKDPSQ